MTWNVFSIHHPVGQSLGAILLVTGGLVAIIGTPFPDALPIGISAGYGWLVGSLAIEGRP